jgi:hypothetical protein
MERKLLSSEKHVEFLYNELEIKEREIDELKKSLNDAQDIYKQKSTSAKSDHNLSMGLTFFHHPPHTKKGVV